MLVQTAQNGIMDRKDQVQAWRSAFDHLLYTPWDYPIASLNLQNASF
jgi:hypothetical protein